MEQPATLTLVIDMTAHRARPGGWANSSKLIHYLSASTTPHSCKAQNYLNHTTRVTTDRRAKMLAAGLDVMTMISWTATEQRG